ncbi:MAG: AAA family ATPase [Terriglobales bacterium]
MYDDREQQEPFDFKKLERLRLFATQILRNQLASLRYFSHQYGFKHLEQSKHVSIASSATCVLSLVASGKWSEHSTEAKTESLTKFLLRQNTSADLEEDNPFTIGWILDAVTALESYIDLDGADRLRARRKEKILQSHIRNAKEGGISIDPYPASAYLTQLVVRVLHRREKLSRTLRARVTEWAWSELSRQLALVQSKSKTADAFAVSYLLMLVASVTPTSEISPEQASIQRVALKTFFECQGKDGTWPLSRPLFHYPKVGSAYCYEYEMLTQLLQQEELHTLLLEYLPELNAAAEAAWNAVYWVQGNIRTWTSGHHPQKGGPESWATASVYHFYHAIDRLAARAVRRELFDYLELPLPTTGLREKKSTDFAKDFLDSNLMIKINGKFRQRSLKKFLWRMFVKPLWEESAGIAEGRIFSRNTPRSAIFFGPPGTSKTELSQKIADFLGWPLLAIDPSHLLRKGMEAIQAEANTIFRMLEQTERVVVLFDEFDELVRERASSDAEPFSRLLTTAMLPKLTRLHKQGTLIFIIATNNIGEFDLAIRRQGRFDHVVQVMPPTYDSKVKKRNWGVSKIDIRLRLRELGVKMTGNIQKMISDLTYLECDSFASDLAAATDKDSAKSILEGYWNDCTLRTPISKSNQTTWEKRCEEERGFSR